MTKRDRLMLLAAITFTVGVVTGPAIFGYKHGKKKSLESRDTITESLYEIGDRVYLSSHSGGIATPALKRHDYQLSWANNVVLTVNNKTVLCIEPDKILAPDCDGHEATCEEIRAALVAVAEGMRQ